jgi:hypothetical protein
MYLVHLSDAFGETSYDTFCKDDNELVNLIRNIKPSYELDGVETVEGIYFDYREFIKNIDNIEHGNNSNNN